MFKQMTNWGTGYVVCCNDSVEAICIGLKIEAERVLRVLAARDYVSKINCNRRWDTYGEYRSMLYWHLHQATIY